MSPSKEPSRVEPKGAEKKPRLVFFGTPDFAVPALDLLAESGRYDIAAVVTQPDKPAGRGHKLTPPPVKRYAEARGIPVLQPASIKNITRVEDPQAPSGATLAATKSASLLAAFLNERAPFEVFVCVAYGKLIPSSLLTFATRGMINIHPSLLPRWRGAAPIQRALFEGDSVTGVSIMEIDEGLDSGPVYARRELQISPQDTLGSLHDRLAAVGAELLLEILPGVIYGSLTPERQSEEGLTYAEKWERVDCVIRWDEPAERTLRRIRTCNPIPGARAAQRGVGVKILAAEWSDAPASGARPGTIIGNADQALLVAAGGGASIAIKELQFPGRRPISAAEALRGRLLSVGDVFDSDIEAGSE